jgi:5'-methylthioadenosine phosphorylase
MLAIIGGSGLTHFSMADTHRKVVRTPWRAFRTAHLRPIRGREDSVPRRHGHGHTIAPHEVNYRANLWALKEENVEGVVSVASVGGIRQDLAPGSLLVPDQLIDYTWGRPSTFYEGAASPVTHIDFTEPYSAALRARILAAARACGRSLRARHLCRTQGPRLETAGEINRLERDGAEVVGMTGMPEAALARELGLEYAAIAVCANFAAGRGESAHAVPMERIEAVLAEAMGRVRRVIEQLVAA